MMLSGGESAGRGMGCIRFRVSVLVLTVLPAIVAPSVWAVEGISACAEAGVILATVKAVGARDGTTIRLADGRDVRLGGVVAAINLDGDDSAVATATAALDRMVAGRLISLYGRAEAKDRYGRLIAQVVIAGEGTNWVQAALVAAGLSRVDPAAGMPACAEALLIHERAARAANLGVWANERFAVQDAEAVKALLASGGRYALVEGTVRRVGEAGGRLFLDFGRRYIEDFSVIIPREGRAAFATAGIDLKKLAGKRVRARGILIFRGGPALEIRLPAALELLDGSGA